MPDLQRLHDALERRAVAMDTDRKYQRSQAYAARRVAETERKKTKNQDGAAAATSASGGKAKIDSLSRDVSNDAKEQAQKRHFWSEMVKVVDNSDIILEVLDARDPEGCRCREVERMIQSKVSLAAQILLARDASCSPLRLGSAHASCHAPLLFFFLFFCRWIVLVPLPSVSSWY